MKNIFDGFESELDELDPRIREKAMEIADELSQSGNYTSKQARKEAIKRAEQWFYDLEG